MPARMLVDENGRDWRVIDVPPSRASRADGWLCFSARDGQRVRIPQDRFTGDWRRLHTTELRKLLRMAKESVERAD